MQRLLFLGLLFVAIAPPQLYPQIPAPKTASHKLAFDVASVRENKSGDRPASNVLLDRSNVYSPTGGILTATNQSVITLIIFAYKMKITESSGGFMRSLPSWARTDKFDIGARAPSADPTKDDMRLMVQTLLEDRFKLKVHRERREMPVYGLYLQKPGKTGPQLKPHNPASSCAAVLPPPAAGTPPLALVGLWPANCGDGDDTFASTYRYRTGGRDMTMSAIADDLSGAGDSPRPILDRTGLSGTFDYIIEFDPESLYGGSMRPHDDSGSTFAEALNDQLGLQLKKEDGGVSIFVVDHIEYPSPN